jgi:hypothetical protein
MRARRIKILAMLIFMISLVTVLPVPVRADGVNLTMSPVSGAPGTTVTVDGTIANTGSTTVFLNNEDFTLGSVFFSNGDITDFLLNAPLFLDGGTNSGSIPLFTFDIALGTPTGLYTGNFLDILGGPGSSDQNLLSSAEFSITVTSEPGTGTLALLGTALLLVGAFFLRRKSTPYTIGQNHLRV